MRRIARSSCENRHSVASSVPQISDCRFQVSDLRFEMVAAVGAEHMKERTRQFAIHVIGLCRVFRRTQSPVFISRQLMRAATSVGTNYLAVYRARSTPDLVSKLGVVLEDPFDRPKICNLKSATEMARRSLVFCRL